MVNIGKYTYFFCLQISKYENIFIYNVLKNLLNYKIKTICDNNLYAYQMWLIH